MSSPGLTDSRFTRSLVCKSDAAISPGTSSHSLMDFPVPNPSSAASTSASALRLQEQLLTSYMNLDASYSQSKHFLTQAELKQVFTEAADHPVTSLEKLRKYDPKGFIGFCFGRATAVTLLVRRMSLKSSSIAKLFIIGDLKSGNDPELRFHVTTLVKCEGEKWYAIDPMMTPPLAKGGPLPIEEWIRIVKTRWDRDDKAVLYVSEEWIIVPDITADDEGTTGKHIIELGFNPSTQDGFRKIKTGNYTLHWVERPAELEYFLGILSPGHPSRFELLGIVIPSLAKIGIDPNVSYNNYFVDLLNSFTRPQPIEAK